MSAAALKTGFSDAVSASQSVFRTVMMALARPGTIRRIACGIDAPATLDPAAAAVALALCDFESTLWLDETLARDEGVTEFLRFHTSAPVIAEKGLAAFAFFHRGSELPPFEAFAPGSLEYPDRSTTLVVPVEHLADDEGWRVTGPGVAGEGRFNAGPLPADILERLARNHALFPRGVDLVLTCGDRLAAIPRSTLVEA